MKWFRRVSSADVSAAIRYLDPDPQSGVADDRRNRFKLAGQNLTLQHLVLIYRRFFAHDRVEPSADSRTSLNRRQPGLRSDVTLRGKPFDLAHEKNVRAGPYQGQGGNSDERPGKVIPFDQ